MIRTQIYLPQRQPAYNSPDALMGMDFAMKIISACFTHAGDFYVLDDHYGLHVVIKQKITFLLLAFTTIILIK